MFPSRRITTMGGDKFRDEYSLSFDGTNDYVDCGDTSDYHFDNSSASLFHVNIWVKITGGTNDDDTFISKYDYGANQREWRISVDGSQQIKCVFSNNGTSVATAQTSSTLAQDRWYNIGLTYDGSQGTADDRCIIYLDGVVQTFSSSGSIDIPAQVNEDVAQLTIGCLLNSGIYSGQGPIKVSEASIYNTALSASQVKTLYNGREPYNHKEGIASGNLKAWWRMGDTTGRKGYVTSEEQIVTTNNREFGTGDSDWIAHGSPTAFTDDGSGKLIVQTSGNSSVQGAHLGLGFIDGSGNAHPIVAGRTYMVRAKLDNTAGKTTPVINIIMGGSNSGVKASDGNPIDSKINTTEQEYYAFVTPTNATNGLIIYQTSADNDATTTFTIDDVFVNEVGVIKDDSSNSNDGNMLNMTADDFVGDTP